MADNEDPRRPQNPFAPALRSVYGGVSAYPLDLGPAPIVPSQPGGLLPEQGVPIKLPGANYPPAGAIAVDLVGDGNIAPAASATLVTFTVPDGLRFRADGIGFGADDEVALRFLTWSIRFNGDPVAAGYNNVPAAVGSIRQLAPIFQLVGSSILFTVLAAADPTAVLTYRYVCRVKGWVYSEREVG